MSVRAALSSLSLVAFGALLCLVVLFTTGALSSSTTTARPSPTTASSKSTDTPTSLSPASTADASPSTTSSTTPPNSDKTSSDKTRDAAVVDAEPVDAEPVDAEAEALPESDTIAPPGPNAFMASFDTPEEFFEEFDYGFSGQDPASNGNADRITSWTGDHDTSCGSPDSQRTIDVERNTNDLFGGTYRDFDDMFWWCREHVMTGVSSVGYNIAWFSPKPTFTDITRVCWDVNLTDVASRKWTQVLFVSEADALSHPSERGSGGFDLGYTNPMFQEPGGPGTEVFPSAGDLAGVQVLAQGLFRWFENETQWTTDNVGAPVTGNFDKATRYTHCLEQLQPGTIRITQERPDSHGGFQQIDVPGTIPSGPLRVVFQDDNYNGPKSENYDPEFNTWHWDDIVIE